MQGVIDLTEEDEDDQLVHDPIQSYGRAYTGVNKRPRSYFEEPSNLSQIFMNHIAETDRGRDKRQAESNASNTDRDKQYQMIQKIRERNEAFKKNLANQNSTLFSRAYQAQPNIRSVGAIANINSIPNNRGISSSHAANYSQMSAALGNPNAHNGLTKYATISFSLLNTKEFAAKADEGHLSKDIIRTIRQFTVRLDDKQKRIVFQLVDHDRLMTALASHHVFVEPLPRQTIATAMLQNSRDIEAMGREGSALLSDRLSPYIISCLAPFQQDGVAFVMKKNGRAFICDEMGLGKTRSAIASAAVYKDDWPLLVVCPSSARHHWLAELLVILGQDLLTPKDIFLIESASSNLPTTSTSSSTSASSATSSNIVCSFKVAIISYALIAKMVDKLLSVPFNVIIADESHYMKNSKAKRTKVLVPLIQRSRRAILLSGTPALSRPIELFTQLNALDASIWNDEKSYGKRYCKMKRSSKSVKSSGFGNEFKGASNTRELHIILTNTVMIRRLKKDILSQLPAKIRKIIKVEISDQQKREELKAILDEIVRRQQLAAEKKRKKKSSDDLIMQESNIPDERNKVKDDEDANKDEKNAILMQLFTRSGEAKLSSIMTYIDDFLNDPLSGKILIFAHHQPVLDRIQQHIQNRMIDFIRIDGRTSSKDRQLRSQHFQNSAPCRVAILSITAAGIAITLTAAATVYFAEIYWTPGSLIQAEDRAHRIGQTNTVTIVYFLADGTIDELLWPLVRQKLKTLGEIVEGHDDADLITSKPTTKKQKKKSADDLNESQSSSSGNITNNDETHENNPEEFVKEEEYALKSVNSYEKLQIQDEEGVNDETNQETTKIADMNELEDVAKELAIKCSDNITSKTEDNEDEEDEEDEEDVDNTDNMKDSGNFEKLLEEDNEEIDPLAALYKLYLDLRNNPEKMAQLREKRKQRLEEQRNLSVNQYHFMQKNGYNFPVHPSQLGQAHTIPSQQYPYGHHPSYYPVQNMYENKANVLLSMNSSNSYEKEAKPAEVIEILDEDTVNVNTNLHRNTSMSSYDGDNNVINLYDEEDQQTSDRERDAAGDYCEQEYNEIHQDISIESSAIKNEERSNNYEEIFEDFNDKQSFMDLAEELESTKTNRNEVDDLTASDLIPKTESTESNPDVTATIDTSMPSGQYTLFQSIDEDLFREDDL